MAGASVLVMGNSAPSVRVHHKRGPARTSVGINQIVGWAVLMAKPSRTLMHQRVRLSILRMRSRDIGAATNAALLRAVESFVLTRLERATSDVHSTGAGHQTVRVSPSGREARGVEGRTRALPPSHSGRSSAAG